VTRGQVVGDPLTTRVKTHGLTQRTLTCTHVAGTPAPMAVDGIAEVQAAEEEEERLAAEEAAAEAAEEEERLLEAAAEEERLLEAAEAAAEEAAASQPERQGEVYQ